MKKLQYRITSIEDNIRYLDVYSDGKLFVQLECLGGFLTNEEEIQFWLDDNGYGDELFEFEKID